ALGLVAAGPALPSEDLWATRIDLSTLPMFSAAAIVLLPLIQARAAPVGALRRRGKGVRPEGLTLRDTGRIRTAVKALCSRLPRHAVTVSKAVESPARFAGHGDFRRVRLSAQRLRAAAARVARGGGSNASQEASERIRTSAARVRSIH